VDVPGDKVFVRLSEELMRTFRSRFEGLWMNWLRFSKRKFLFTVCDNSRLFNWFTNRATLCARQSWLNIAYPFI
jgi:hypothetical protein